MTLSRSTVLRTSLRERKCVICTEKFKQARPMQKVCSPACAAVQGRRDSEKQAAKAIREKKAAERADRVETKKALEKFKTKSEWMADLQKVFNAFIRERDRDQPCICCGRTNTKDYLTGSAWDAGHFRSVGSAPHLRFHEDNVHRQLVHCNRHGAGRAVDYRLGLIARIGLARVEALENDQTPRHYTIDQLKTMKTEYAAKLKALKEAA